MKNLSISILVLISLLGLTLGACNLQVAGPVVPTQTETPDETGAADSGEPRSLAAVDLSDLPVGTTMRWYDNSLLVLVPGGEFIMGADGTDNPVHTVSLDDFWIYKTEVTNDMYRLCVASGACTPPADALPIPKYLVPELKDHPVVDVTWAQADEYCAWMNAHLPTEAEWEKTARGPGGNIYPWGQAAPTCDLLNYEACELDATSRVYDYPDGLSHYLAADMAGNIYEWAADWYASNYYSIAPDENPPGPETGTLRVVRASSFRSPADELPSALRYGIAPETSRDDLGFRCVVAGDAAGFAPFCQLTAFIPGGEFSPEAPWGEPGEYTGPETEPCEPGVPSASSRNYCFDQASSTGGATVTYSGELVDWDAGCVPGDSPIGCTGPEGTTIDVRICNYCFPAVPFGGEDIEPTCAPGYSFVDGMCVYGGFPTLPGGDCPPGWFPDPDTGLCKAALPLPDSELCPEGYSYYEALSCCLAAFTDPLPEIPGLPAHSYPGCPIGTTYDEPSGFCLPEGDPALFAVEDCRDFPVVLGWCDEPGDDPGDDPGGCVNPVGCSFPPNCGAPPLPPCCCP